MVILLTCRKAEQHPSCQAGKVHSHEGNYELIKVDVALEHKLATPPGQVLVLFPCEVAETYQYPSASTKYSTHCVRENQTIMWKRYGTHRLMAPSSSAV